MQYSSVTNPKLKKFCLEISKFLLENRRIELDNFKKLDLFFSSDSLVLKHTLVLHCYSEKRKDDGTIVKLSEKVMFKSKEYFIKTFSQEDYFGEYYTNNDYRIGDNEEEEYIEEYLKDAFMSIVSILKEDNGYLTISTKG